MRACAVTYNQEHVLELRRISFPLYVRLDGRLAIFGKHTYSTRLETRNVEHHTPHAKVNDTAEIAKQVQHAHPGPFERAAVCCDAERCSVRNQVACEFLQLEEPVEIGVHLRVEDELQETSGKVATVRFMTTRICRSLDTHKGANDKRPLCEYANGEYVQVVVVPTYVSTSTGSFPG